MKNNIKFCGIFFLFLTNCMNSANMENKDHDTIKKMLGIDLPNYADNIHLKSENLMGLMVYLRIDIPSDKLHDFLSISPRFPKEISDKMEEPIDFSVYNEYSDWWIPDEELINPMYGAEYGIRGKWNTSCYVLGQSKENIIQIYLMYFEEP